MMDNTVFDNEKIRHIIKLLQLRRNLTDHGKEKIRVPKMMKNCILAATGDNYKYIIVPGHGELKVNGKMRSKLVSNIFIILLCCNVQDLWLSFLVLKTWGKW